MALTSSRQISSASKSCWPFGATAPVSAMLKPTLIGSAACAAPRPNDSSNRNQNAGAARPDGTFAMFASDDLLPSRHDGTGRSLAPAI